MISPNVLHCNTSIPQRTPVCTYHPANAPERTACVVYIDPVLGLVACSHRSTLGIMRVSTSINFDAGVVDQLQRADVQWLEVFIRDIKITYRVTLESMLLHGKHQERVGLQIALALKYWSVDMPAAQLKPVSTEEQPAAAQLNLFGGNNS